MTGIKRCPDWEKRLAEFLLSRMETPFVWGKQDCALFVCDAVLAMTGTDLAAEARGQYATVNEVKAWLAAKTRGGGLAEYAARIAELHGLPEIHLAQAQRGDVLLWRQSEVGATLGIVGLDGIYGLFAGPQGILRRRVRQCDQAWRIP